jgi:hypothetical protein
MAWVRLDDGFMRHPKAQAAGVQGRALFISGLCWCAANRVNGHIPEAVVPLLAFEAGVKPAVAAALVKNRLWHPTGETCSSEDCPAHSAAVQEGEYVVHDICFYQPTKEWTEARRQARAEAGRKGGVASGEARRRSKGEATGEANGKQVASLLRNPDPTRPDLGVKVCTTDDDEMLCGASSSSVVEKAALVFGFAQAATSQQAIDNPARYANGVARNVLAEQGERLRAYVAEHPSDDAEAVAANVFKLDRWALIGARKAMP